MPALILTLGHLRSIPFLLLIFTFSYYELFIEAGSFMNVVYSENEKQTFMVTGLLLSFLVLYTEYIRYKLSRGLYEESIAKNHLEFLSNHDELTGLYNRRGFYRELKKQMSFLSVKRINLPLSC